MANPFHNSNPPTPTGGGGVDLTPEQTEALQSLMALGDGEIPMGSGNGLTASTMTQEDDRVRSTTQFEAPDAGAYILGNFDISNAGSNIVAEELASGRRFIPVAYELTDEGSQPPSYEEFGAATTLTSFSDESTVFSGAVLQYAVRSTVRSSVVSIELSIPPNSPAVDECNILVGINSHTHEPHVFDYKRSTGGVGFNLPANTSTTENLRHTVAYPRPAFFQEGVDFYITFAAIEGQTLRLNGQVIDQGTGLGNQNVVFVNNTVRIAQERLIRQDVLDAIANSAFNSGRPFLTFNDGFTIDRTNLASFEDKNIIYTAKNDKPLTSPSRPDVILPNDVEIAASGEAYPIVFEFTHLGGTVRSSTTNIVRFSVDDVIQSTILQREDVAVVIKEGVGIPYEFREGSFDPNTSFLPNGVFNLHDESHIEDIASIASTLGSVTIESGDGFLVETGGTWSGYTVPNHSVLVALVDSPSLTDSNTNNDWLLLDNQRMAIDQMIFLNNFQREGNVFTGNRNIRIDPFNVMEFRNNYVTTPVQSNFILFASDVTQQTITIPNVNIQLDDVVGGLLSLSGSLVESSSAGFPPELLTLRFTYGSTVFEFPLGSVELGSAFTLNLPIPNADYSGALNVNPTVELVVNYRGQGFVGYLRVEGLVNLATGALHQPILNLINTEVTTARSALEQQITDLRGEVVEGDESLAAITDRISPYRNEVQTTPNIQVRFLDSTGSDAFPSTLASMSSVLPDAPVFPVAGTSLFVAVPQDGTQKVLLNNNTQLQTDLSSSNAQGDPNLDLGGSLADANNTTYFIFRVSGLTVGHEFEVLDLANVRSVAWQEDIDSLGRDIERIDVELSRAVLDLPVTITEESSPVTTPTDFQRNLVQPSAQTIYVEPTPVTSSSGTTSSAILSSSDVSRRGNKLVYIPDDVVLANGVMLRADDGASTNTDLMSYVNGSINVNVFVPAQPATTTNTLIYPAQSNSVSGEGIWQTLEAITSINGIPTPEANELFFTRNVPSVSSTLEIQYRGHANSNVFGLSSTNLAGVGGSSDVSTTFTLTSGSESATVEVLYRASTRDIRVSVSERVSAGLPTINDVQVIMSYLESRTVPATSATTRQVTLEQDNNDSTRVFAIEESTGGDLIIVGSEREINTGYAYTTLFGATLAGHLNVNGDSSVFYDYQSFTPSSVVINVLEQHASLPRFGLFNVSYSHDTVVTLDTQLVVHDSNGDELNVGDVLTELLNKVT